MKKVFVLLILGFFQLINSQWTSNYSGNGTSNTSLVNAHGTAIAIDHNGHAYITGYIDEGNGSYNNILVIKYNAETGDTIWTAQFNGESNGNDMGYNIAPDNDGNVYVVGTVWNANRDYEIAILKYNSNGTLLWNVITSGDNIQAEDKGLDLVIDNYGNIYLAGFCTSNDNYTDIITQKYNSSGTLLWSRKEDGDDNLNAKGSAIT